MNAQVQLQARPLLAHSLLAMLTPAPSAAVEHGSPLAWLLANADAVALRAADPERLVRQWLLEHDSADAPLVRLARALSLNLTECMALALCHAVATQPGVGRAVAWLQGSERLSNATPGLIASCDQRRGVPAARSLAALLDGEALACGLLQLQASDGALPDAKLTIPTTVAIALCGGLGRWTQVELGDADLPPLAASIRAAAHDHARTLARGEARVVRSAHPREARAACAAIVAALDQQPAFIRGEPPPGLLPWLILHNAVPVLSLELAPGERATLPDFTHGRLPLLVAAGLDGTLDWHGSRAPAWTVPIPADEERVRLWGTHAVDATSAAQLGGLHRHSCARIAELARAARTATAASGPLTHAAVAHVARHSGHGALGSLAELLAEDIASDALVLPDALRRELHELTLRCRHRENLVAGLGVAARNRYRCGVRALLCGASGTGKTLACGWLATQLGLPLYRVDLAAVTSKYIGETEKNLGELFARAEHADVVLLFDEADALFGKRTEVKDANDRFANQQTNYLLQRIESYDGIVLLTSNGRARFDSAFTRRLDAILEFALPAPEERRALWLAHLGDAHCLSLPELNCLAAQCELAGGHVRNASLMAAAAARAEQRAIEYADVLRGVAAEYRKLGKQVPPGLRDRSGAR